MTDQATTEALPERLARLAETVAASISPDVDVTDDTLPAHIPPRPARAHHTR